jgi:NADH-quinone oxidoreductase subunit K
MENGKGAGDSLLCPFAIDLFPFSIMTQLALQHYLAVGAIIFVIGLIGFMTRRNLIVMFLCTELMFQGVAINLIAFGRFWGRTVNGVYEANLHGQAFVIFVLVIAAAEASLALGLVVLLFRQKHTLDADAWRELKG